MSTVNPKDQAHAATGRTVPANYGYYSQESGQPITASEAALQCFRTYARERPEAMAMWAFGIGFVLGWKLRIW